MSAEPTPRSWLAKFILPEDTVTLKVVFDNIRNTFIAASVVVAGRWTQTHVDSNISDIELAKLSSHILGTTVLWFGIVLFALSMAQAGLIAVHSMNGEAFKRRAGLGERLGRLCIGLFLYLLIILVGYLGQSLALRGLASAGP